jgi:hypothetical protein
MRPAPRTILRTIFALALLVGGHGLVDATPAAGQTDGRARPAYVPFGVGERAEYRVTLGIFGSVGTGSMEVTGLETVHGHPTYHLEFKLNGKVLVGSVDDTFESWLDIQGLFARRFHKRQHEISYDADKRYDFFPDRMIYRRYSTGEEDSLATAEPLDDVSFLYYARTLPLKPGDTYTLDRYYKDSGNPVTLKVLRREAMKNPNGQEIPVVVVQPMINTSGLFGEGGEAEVYFTDDWRRILVKMTSKVPVIGRLGLTLTGYTPGQRLDGLEDPDR